MFEGWPSIPHFNASDIKESSCKSFDSQTLSASVPSASALFFCAKANDIWDADNVVSADFYTELARGKVSL